MVHARLADRARSDRALDLLREIIGDGVSYVYAWVHARRGEVNAAFAALDRSHTRLADDRDQGGPLPGAAPRRPPLRRLRIAPRLPLIDERAAQHALVDVGEHAKVGHRHRLV